MKLFANINRLVVKRLSPKEKSSGGIVIPSAVHEDVVRCEILDAGPRWIGETRIGEDAHALSGYVVLTSRHAGVDVVSGGEKYTVITYDDILATETK